jgi:peptidoglycan/LPS O-acetylase OafA/YrhL
LTSAIYLVISFTGRTPVSGYNLRWMLFMVLRGCNAWFWCVSILGFGSKYLRFNHRILPYTNQAVYPVYVLHLPIVMILAYWVLSWNIGVAAQFVVIVLTALAASVGIYEFIIRRTNVTRFLFGLKPKPTKRADNFVSKPEVIPR